MLDSSSRMPSAKRVPTLSPLDWEEATFTRPMRSPFHEGHASGREARTRTPTPIEPPAVDISLEEAALFEAPKKVVRPALHRVTTAPPPRRSLPPPMDDETTSKNKVPSELLRATREPDSGRMLQALAVVDLAKTMEEPILDVCEEHLETSTIRSSD